MAMSLMLVAITLVAITVSTPLGAVRVLKPCFTRYVAKRMQTPKATAIAAEDR